LREQGGGHEIKKRRNLRDPDTFAWSQNNRRAVQKARLLDYLAEKNKKKISREIS